MTDRPPSRTRRQLATELVRVRNRAGLSARQLADRLTASGYTISPATVSRIDNAQRGGPPSRDLVTRWLDVTDADAETRERVMALAETAWTEAARWAELLADTGSIQHEVRRRELDSVQVDNLQLSIIPGLLQTPDYMRALLPLGAPDMGLDVEATVAGRIERQQILYQAGRMFRFLLTERALSWTPDPAVTAGQIDRLLQVTGLTTVQIGVLPISAAIPAPWNCFQLHTRANGSEFVALELIHGPDHVGDLAGVMTYRRLWDRLWTVAALEDDAVEMIRERSR